MSGVRVPLRPHAVESRGGFRCLPFAQKRTHLPMSGCRCHAAVARVANLELCAWPLSSRPKARIRTSRLTDGLVMGVLTEADQVALAVPEPDRALPRGRLGRVVAGNGDDAVLDLEVVELEVLEFQTPGAQLADGGIQVLHGETHLSVLPGGLAGGGEDHEFLVPDRVEQPTRALVDRIQAQALGVERT